MLKSENEFDLELQNRILDDNFKSNIKLLEVFALELGVYKKINTIITVIMKW